MREGLFWAIQGGGGASFGVILAWKIQVVHVPSVVTVHVFTAYRNLEQNASRLVHRWQYIADKLHKDIFIRIMLQSVNSTQEAGKLMIRASFGSLFLGRVERLLPLMQMRFFGVGCFERRFLRGSSLDVLLHRISPLGVRLPFKGKSDYVNEPISEIGLEGIWERFYEEEVGMALMILTPYGGKMSEISEFEIPFPHRKGVRTYLNYRDLDIEKNSKGISTSYEEASAWVIKYFKNNFNRLVHVKTMVDSNNFFRNEQSIPPFSSQ